MRPFFSLQLWGRSSISPPWLPSGSKHNGSPDIHALSIQDVKHNIIKIVVLLSGKYEATVTLQMHLT